MKCYSLNFLALIKLGVKLWDLHAKSRLYLTPSK